MLNNQNDSCILTVEDNPGDFILVQAYLQEKFPGYKILHAMDFKSAKQMILDPSCKIEVILLDLMLPDLSGAELIESVFKFSLDIPVIVLTGNDNLEFSIRSISLGVSDYLIKDQLNEEILYKSIIFSIERKKIYSKLKESEDRFERLFYESPEAMWVYDPSNYEITMVNNAALRMLGYSEEEFLDMGVFELVHPIEREEVKSKILPLDPTRKATQSGINYKLINRGGNMLYAELFSAPLFLEGKLYRSVIAIDITDRVAFDNKLTRAIIKTQEDERYEIGSELHDNVCQLLAAVQMFISLLKPSVKDEGLHMLERVSDNTSIAIKEIRNLSHRLAPAFFSDSTLEDALFRLIGDFALEKEVEIHVSIDPLIKKMEMSRDLILNLYRILQEQMRNIQKYSRATRIDLTVAVKGKELQMDISDNGVGFDTLSIRSGIGLANMKRRAELFGGSTFVKSSPGNGCQLQVKIPL